MSDSSFPDFLVLGAPKAGTTALCEYLNGHPELSLSHPKEARYFILHYHRGPEWYRENCYGKNSGRLCGEGTPNYLGMTFALKRIRQDAPQAKLFVLLRDPAERAFSSWWMRVSWGQEGLGFEAALRVCLEQPGLDKFLSPNPDGVYQRIRQGWREGRPYYRGYLHNGLYGPQLSELRTLFAPSQIMVIWSGDLKRDPAGTVRRALEFLGLDPALRLGNLKPRWAALGVRTAYLREMLRRRTSLSGFQARAFDALAALMRLTGDRPPQISENQRRFLLDYYRNSDQILAEQLGELPPWRQGTSP